MSIHTTQRRESLSREKPVERRNEGWIVRNLSAIYSDLAGPEHLIRSPFAVFSHGKDYSKTLNIKNASLL